MVGADAALCVVYAGRANAPCGTTSPAHKPNIRTVENNARNRTNACLRFVYEQDRPHQIRRGCDRVGCPHRRGSTGATTSSPLHPAAYSGRGDSKRFRPQRRGCKQSAADHLPRVKATRPALPAPLDGADGATGDPASSCRASAIRNVFNWLALMIGLAMLGVKQL
jgi:hypothetical protein